MKPNRIRPLVNAGLVALLFACGGGNPTGPVVTPPSTKPPVQQQNRAPAWSSSPITFCNENASYSYVLNAPDPDGDNVTYSLIQSPSWLSISGNTLSGECPEVFRDSSFAVEISASDQKAQPVSQKYSLTAKNKFNVYVLSGSQSKSTGMNMNAADTAFTFTVNPDTSISFPYPVNFIVPDIVASGITPQTPKGLIRKIKDISSDKKRIYTEQATIEEIAKKASVPFSKQLLPSDINLSVMRSLEHMPHLYSPQNTLAGFNFGLPINETIEGVTISGDIYFNLSLDVQIDIDWFTLKNFSFKQTLSDVSNLRISSNIFGAALSKEVSLLTIPFNPITIGVLPTLPIPTPIVITPELEIVAGINAESLNPIGLGVKQEAELTVGITYNEATKWNSSFTISNQFDSPSNSVITGDWDLKAYTGPRLRLPFYGIAGPQGGINAYLKLQSQDFNWKFLAGLEATGGVDIKFPILGKKAITIAPIETTLEEKVLAEGKQEIQTVTDTIYLGPEGKDASVRHDGTKYYGEGDSPFIRFSKDYKAGTYDIEEEGLLEFSLSKIPAGSKITSAKLNVYGYATSFYDHSPIAILSKLLGSWDEETVKWDTKPPEKEVSTFDFVNEGLHSSYEIDVTPFVQAWVSGEPNYGLSISTRKDRVNGELRSGDNPEIPKRPTLIVTYQK